MPTQPRIPAATRTQESRVIHATPERVWAALRPLHFAWWSSVKSATVEGGKEAEVGSHRKVVFNDGAVQTYKLLELSDLHHVLTYDVITSEPALVVSSAIHTIRLHHVTHDNTTLIEWESDFSNEATQEVVQDSQFKKQEAFASLAAYLVKTEAGKRASSPVRASSPKKAKN